MACNSICPPSPAPPAGDGPRINVFSAAPAEVAPTVKLPVINTFWFRVLTDDAVSAKEAVVAKLELIVKLEVVAKLELVANDALVTKDALVAKLAVPNKEPVKLFAVTLPIKVLGPLTVKLPVILTEPVNW